MTDFRIVGPFSITCATPRYVDIDDAKEFWTDNTVTKWKHRKGVYVLAARNRGITPLYVGRTRRDFLHEALGTFQLNHFNGALRHIGKCTPIVFFLVSEGRGLASTAIEELETDLIQAAKRINPNLRNRRGVKPRSWTIHGVGLRLDFRTMGKGTATAVKDFCRMMSAHKTKH